jgi:cyclopropane fatty-acyl-phospholipid synthase-like methyltransferase
MNYDDAYRKSSDFFGTEPHDNLKKYFHLMDKNRLALDVGAGQGRNALFLARQGFTVDAIDPSQVAFDITARAAAEENLPVRIYCSGFEDFIPEKTPYGGILLCGIIQILSWQGIHLLVEKIRAWTTADSLVFITAFTIDDPSYENNASRLKKIGKNSFLNEDGEPHTYLEPGEILTLFDGFTVVHHIEGLGPMHSHGGREPHRHARVRAVLRI